MDELQKLQEEIGRLTKQYEDIEQKIYEEKKKSRIISELLDKLKAKHQALQVEKDKSERIKKYLLAHAKDNPEYIGVADGTVEKLNAICRKCQVHLDLYKYPTGIGTVLIGHCSGCDAEINFTDYSRW